MLEEILKYGYELSPTNCPNSPKGAVAVADAQPNSPLHIVVAPDSLKSTATAHQAAEWLAAGAHLECVDRGLPEPAVTLAPMADGGEGTASCFAGETVILPTTDARGRLIEASYVFDAASATAYIDIAAASGLPQVEDDLQPLSADTYGTGVLIADAQTRGATRVVLALGGSATTDGGTGILTALGAQPLDARGLPLRPGGGDLHRIASIDTAQLNIPAAALEWVLLTDVRATATGPTGTALNYAPQKGANREQVALLEGGIAKLCEVTGVDPTAEGFGAAGGAAIGITWLSQLLHGTTEHVHMLPGAKVVAETLGLADLVENADLVITAEGGFNQQSLDGKVVGTILDIAGASAGQPKVALAAGSFDAELPADALKVVLTDQSLGVQTQLEQAGRDAVRAYLDSQE